MGSGPQATLRVDAGELIAQLDLARDAIFSRDAKRRITFWNRGAWETYGFTLEEALGRRPQDLLRSEYPIALEEIERLVTETGGWEGQLVQRTRDGRRLVVESRWAAQYDPDGGLAGLLEVNRDVSSQFARQVQMLEFAPDAFVGVGRDGLIVFVNSQVEALFGYTREELLAEPIETLVPAEVRERHAALRERYFENPRTRPMGAGLELFGRRRDGSEFPAEISLSAVSVDGGEMALAAIRDISARIAASEEREQLRAAAERERMHNQVHEAHRLESLGQLAGGIAHDFNNLLAVVTNYAELVARELEEAAERDGAVLWETTREDLGQISLAAERAAHLTHQLLAFARREVVQPELVDVNGVVEDVEQLLRRTLGEHIELRSSLGAALRCVTIDPGQLEQILVNLAVNARDAMPDGGMLRVDTLNVDVDETYAGPRPGLSCGAYVSVRVSDNGVGMPPEVRDRAFDPFFTTKPPGQGTGLGLATVYGIVQQAGGRVQIYSEHGVGTTITTLLPATDAKPPPARAPARHVRPSGEHAIMLVEDEAPLREVISRVLTSGGYKVIVAANGVEAIEAAELCEQLDLLVTDVIMPQLSGPLLAERMRERYPSLKVLFMSGFAKPILDDGKGLEDGAALLEKPFSASLLLERVEELVSR